MHIYSFNENHDELIRKPLECFFISAYISIFHNQNVTKWAVSVFYVSRRPVI